MKFTLSLLLIFMSFVSLSQAEKSETDTTVVVTMNDGVVRIGAVLSDDGREMLFMDKSIGKIYITKQDIKSIIPFTQSSESFAQTPEGYFSGPEGIFTTRYYFTTNSLPIKKGESYAMIHLYGPEVHFSVSNRLSIGIMTTWIASPFVVVGKYSIPTKNEKLNFGIGTMMGTSGYLNGFQSWGGMHWGMVTFGDRLRNLTFSAGYAYVNTGFDNSYATPGEYDAVPDAYSGRMRHADLPTTRNKMLTAPVIGLAGVARIGKRASFIFDSMIFFPTTKKGSSVKEVYDVKRDPSKTIVTETEGGRKVFAFFMPGMRFQSNTKAAFQIALAGVLYEDPFGVLSSFPIPMISWFRKF